MARLSSDGHRLPSEGTSRARRKVTRRGSQRTPDSAGLSGGAAGGAGVRSGAPAERDRHRPTFGPPGAGLPAPSPCFSMR